MYYDEPWPQSIDHLLDPLIRYLREMGLEFEEDPLRNQVLQNIIINEPQENDHFKQVSADQAMADILDQTGITYPDGNLVHQALRVMFSIAESHWQPEVDALPLLRQLKSDGYLIGLISNASDTENVDHILAKGGFPPYLDTIITSVDFGYGKPGAEIFRHALKTLDIGPEEAIMVGDKLQADILGANRMGIRSVWITRRVKNSSQSIDNPELTPWKTVETLQVIQDLLRK